MPKWILTVAIWAVVYSPFFVWLLPIPESIAKGWCFLVVVSILIFFAAYAFEVMGPWGIILAIILGTIFTIIAKVYERAGGWFIALLIVVGAGVYIHNLPARAANAKPEDKN